MAKWEFNLVSHIPDWSSNQYTTLTQLRCTAMFSTASSFLNKVCICTENVINCRNQYTSLTWTKLSVWSKVSVSGIAAISVRKKLLEHFLLYKGVKPLGTVIHFRWTMKWSWHVCERKFGWETNYLLEHSNESYSWGLVPSVGNKP